MNDHIPDATKMISDEMISDGGPAFSCVYYSEPIGSIGPQLIIKGGMTLRDYFAAAAINEVGRYNNINQSAIMAYEIADAMLKAREEK